MSGIEDYIPQNACPMHLDMRLLLFYDCYVVPLYHIHSHNRSTDNHLIITSRCAVLVSCVMPWWLLKSDHMWMIFHNVYCFWFFSNFSNNSKWIWTDTGPIEAKVSIQSWAKMNKAEHVWIFFIMLRKSCKSQRFFHTW